MVEIVKLEERRAARRKLEVTDGAALRQFLDELDKGDQRILAISMVVVTDNPDTLYNDYLIINDPLVHERLLGCMRLHEMSVVNMINEGE